MNNIPSIYELIAIFIMFLTTYATRLSGFIFFRNKVFSPKSQQILDILPSCIMISIAAPAFLNTNINTIIALLIALLASFRFSLATAVIAAVLVNNILNYILG